MYSGISLKGLDRRSLPLRGFIDVRNHAHYVIYMYV